MKKTYYSPDMDVVELQFCQTLLAGSDPEGAEGGGSDGGVVVTPGDPSGEGWDDDF